MQLIQSTFKTQEEIKMKLYQLEALKALKKVRKGLVANRATGKGFYAFSHDGRIRKNVPVGNMDIREEIEKELHKAMTEHYQPAMKEKVLEEQALLHEPSGIIMREELEKQFTKLMYVRNSDMYENISLYQSLVAQTHFVEHEFDYGPVHFMVKCGPHIDRQSLYRNIEITRVHKMVEENVDKILALPPRQKVRLASKKRNIVVLLRAISGTNFNVELQYITTFPYSRNEQPRHSDEILIEMED